MANTIEVTKLLDGQHLIYHVYLKSDGASGDIDSYVLIDPATESMGDDTVFALEDITWGFNGFSANIHFEFLVDDTLIWVLPPSTGNYVDFKKYGNLKDRGNPGDATGKVLLSTTGFADLGDEGSMIIKVRKSNRKGSV